MRSDLGLQASQCVSAGWGVHERACLRRGRWVLAPREPPRRTRASSQKKNASDDWAATRGMQLDIPTLAATRWNPDTSIESEALLAVSSVHAPKRSLQHGRLVDLWWQFVAWWDAGSAVAGEGTCPGWATFWRSWSERWQHALRFRKSSEHSQCNACWQYGQALARSASSVQEKQAIARNWREHLRLAS